MTTATKTKRSSTSSRSASRTTAKNQDANTYSTQRILALDAGNYDLKFYDGKGHPKAIRSVRYQVPQGRDAVSYSEASPLIELPDGRRYHFGAQAYKYRRQQQTVVENKVELAHLCLYACLEPLGRESADFDLDLYVSTPDPARNADEIQRQLLGVHQFTRNDVEFRVTVKSVEVAREGMGAYYYAQKQGMIPDTGYTIVIDIGGGTWLTRLVDADGEVIDENIMDRGGTYELATAISFDRRLTDVLGTTADPCVVMDGFRVDHSYADTELSWAAWLDEYLDSWFKGIFQTVKAQYTPYMPRVTRFLVTGGGSHLITDRLAGRKLFTVMGDPQFANVRGLFLLSEDTQLSMSA